MTRTAFTVSVHDRLASLVISFSITCITTLD
jgi:hypothetical protein